MTSDIAAALTASAFVGAGLVGIGESSPSIPTGGGVGVGVGLGLGVAVGVEPWDGTGNDAERLGGSGLAVFRSGLVTVLLAEPLIPFSSVARKIGG